MSASPARTTALKIVSRVRERNAFAHETADAVIRASQSLDPRDKALAIRLAYGTIATSGTLDEALDRFIAQPNKVEPRVRDALNYSAWELLFGGADAHVAVSQGVDLARSVRSQASGLANAVLRRLAEAASSFPWGDPDNDTAALARRYGHPLWITETLVADLGRSTAEVVLAADNEPAPVYLAVLGPEKSDSLLHILEEAGAEPNPGPLPGSLQIGRPSALTSSSAIPPGLAEFCDAAAQFVAHVVRPTRGMRLVDIGAGRGTKTLLMQSLARRTGGDAEIWAVDSHEFKGQVLLQRVAEAGFGSVHAVTADGTALPVGNGIPEAGGADAVLIDAPCSGLGTLRRHPDKRWRLLPAQIEELAALSARLLAEGSILVGAGGFMVYSTCTLTARENRDVVENFLASGAGEDFVLDDLTADAPESWRRFVAPEGWFQSVPEVGGPDGHFVARLKHM